MDSLEEALKDLRDIHDPNPISLWPLAPGWWLLLALLVVGILFLRWWLKKRKSPGFKKLANQELKNIITNYEVQKDTQKTCLEIATLIRKLLVARDTNHKVAGLIDNEWLSYLDEVSRSHLFTEGPGKILTTAIYQKEFDADINGLVDATKVLIKHV